MSRRKISKDVRKEMEQVGAGNDQIAKARWLCESYGAASDRLKVNRVKHSDARKRYEQAVFPLEVQMIGEEISQLNCEIERDEKICGIVNAVLGRIPMRPRIVLTRLYVEEYPWRMVYDENGKLLTQGSVEYAKNNGLAIMAVEISKQDMWAEVDALREKE